VNPRRGAATVSADHRNGANASPRGAKPRSRGGSVLGSQPQGRGRIRFANGKGAAPLDERGRTRGERSPWTAMLFLYTVRG